MSSYGDFYRTGLGKKVLEKESLLAAKRLKGCKRILSIGCGPAFLEARLKRLLGAEVIGLEKDKEMIAKAGKKIGVFEGNAEKMAFADNSFDCALFVTSLEFIGDLKKAVAETARVLKAGGKILAMVLNPESDYFRERAQKKGSYFKKIRHTDLDKIREAVEKFFSVKGGYFLGIKGGKVFDSCGKKTAALYVLRGVKK